jgi:competence protein ComEA
MAVLSGEVAPRNAFQDEKQKAAEEADWSALLPEGEGKTEVALACSNCHGLKQLITQKKTRAGWQTSVQKMIAVYQVPVAQEDFQILVAYLAKHFGEGNPIERLPMNINTSSAEALGRLPGVGAETAKAIVESREASGPFAAVEDLSRVKGIDAETLKRIRPYLKVED